MEGHVFWERPWQYELMGQAVQELIRTAKSPTNPALQIQVPRKEAPEFTVVLLVGHVVHTTVMLCVA